MWQYDIEGSEALVCAYCTHKSTKTLVSMIKERRRKREEEKRRWRQHGFNPLSFTAGEAISENDAVFLDLSDGEIYKATVDLIDNTHFFLGIAAASAAENASVAVYTQGQIDFTVDGAVGEDLYLTSDPGVVATNPTFPYAVVVGRSQTLM